MGSWLYLQEDEMVSVERAEPGTRYVICPDYPAKTFTEWNIWSPAKKKRGRRREKIELLLPVDVEMSRQTATFYSFCVGGMSNSCKARSRWSCHSCWESTWEHLAGRGPAHLLCSTKSSNNFRICFSQLCKLPEALQQYLSHSLGLKQGW